MKLHHLQHCECHLRWHSQWCARLSSVLDQIHTLLAMATMIYMHSTLEYYTHSCIYIIFHHSMIRRGPTTDMCQES